MIKFKVLYVNYLHKQLFLKSSIRWLKKITQNIKKRLQKDEKKSYEFSFTQKKKNALTQSQISVTDKRTYSYTGYSRIC